jgi:hypothetical protein
MVGFDEVSETGDQAIRPERPEAHFQVADALAACPANQFETQGRIRKREHAPKTYAE